MKGNDWITSREAADILTKNSGHKVSAGYLRQLAILGKVRTKSLDGRTKLYWRKDVKGIHVKQRGTREDETEAESVGV